MRPGSESLTVGVDSVGNTESVRVLAVDVGVADFLRLEQSCAISVLNNLNEVRAGENAIASTRDARSPDENALRG